MRSLDRTAANSDPPPWPLFREGVCLPLLLAETVESALLGRQSFACRTFIAVR